MVIDFICQSMRRPAPIVLFVYNRPAHTRRLIESLLCNSLAVDSDLFIFSDGPARESDRLKVAEVRRYLAEISGFRSVAIHESTENQGLARSIILGVTRVVNEYGKVIVLEDDLVVSPHFLSYMNDALVDYSEADQVMHVSGYWFPVVSEQLPETFFLPVPSSWGWATWARAWRYFEKNPQELKNTFTMKDIRRFNLDGANDFWEQVLHNLNGKANTWAIFWYAAIFRRNGLCLYPSRSLVQNNGSDGSGVHCLITDIYQGEIAQRQPADFPDMLAENPAALNVLQAFYRQHRTSRMRRFVEVVRVKMRRMLAKGM